jgi:pSer/pThr/pTyr-binding forkhead associated (FHA) protein
VSGHHASVARDGDHFVVEDLHSTNGTFVNERRVSRHVLQDGDVLLVGKHQLVFERRVGDEPVVVAKAEPATPALGDTMFLDTKKHRELIANLREANSAAASKGRAAGAVEAKVGVLHVISGRSDQTEYPLEARTCLIGKAQTNAVRLKGWFKPRVAAAITRNREGYVVTQVAGKMTINSELGSGRHDLKDGDILAVGGLTLEFRLRQDAQRP